MGMLTALSAGLIAAMVMGAVLYVTQHYTGFYLVVVFPILAGGVTGLALSKAINFAKVSNDVVAALIGLIAACFLFGTQHYAKYQLEFKDDARQSLMSKNLQVTDIAVNEITDEFLKSQTGATGFVGFLQLEAQRGISITRNLVISSSGFEIKGIWYWVYSAFEFCIVLFTIVGLAVTEPFNEAKRR